MYMQPSLLMNWRNSTPAARRSKEPTQRQSRLASSPALSPRWGSGHRGAAFLGSSRLRRSDPRLHAVAPIGAFVFWQFGAGAERRRQAASLQEWANRSKGAEPLAARPQRSFAAGSYSRRGSSSDRTFSRRDRAWPGDRVMSPRRSSVRIIWWTAGGVTLK